MPDLVEQLHQEGYAIVRGFFGADDMRRLGAEVDAVYAQGLEHHASYRDKNLLFEVLDDPRARRRVVLQVHWSAWINPYLELMRRDPRYLAVLEPFLGRDIKQITHQIHWKPPGAKYTFYRYHQDARFRNAAAVRNLLYGTVNTGLAIDPQTLANGALRIIPRSHLHGYLGLSEDGSIMKHTSRISWSRWVRGSSPSTDNSPSNWVRPRMAFSVVVLPEPLGPIRPTMRPGWISKLAWSSASFLP